MICNINYNNKIKKETYEVVILDELYATEHFELDDYVFQHFTKKQLYGHVNMFHIGLRYSYIVLHEDKNEASNIAKELELYLSQNGIPSKSVKSILLWDI